MVEFARRVPLQRSLELLPLTARTALDLAFKWRAELSQSHSSSASVRMHDA
jgi:hypothetical protein